MLERVPYQPKEEPANPLAKQYIPTFLYHDPTDTQGITIRDDFYGTRRKLRIGILGAGITCLNVLHFLEKAIPPESVEIVVYEREKDVGGIWLTSTYPGVRCDIPGILYQFSWRSNIWSEFHPRGAETLQYLQTVARENDFYRYMQFKHEINKAAWSDQDAKWTLSIHDLNQKLDFEDIVDVFLEFSGPVNNPKIKLSGYGSFAGDIVHPGEWNDKIDLTGKRVAVVGSGSTGVQILPSIIDQVSKLYTWFRHKQYVIPPVFGYRGDNGTNFTYSDEQKGLLSDRDVYIAYQREFEENSAKRNSGSVNGSAMAAIGRDRITQYMQEKLASKPGLFEHICPKDFDVGCRRPTFNHGYLEALANPKTTVLMQLPKSFSENGVIDAEGNEHALDIIIAATGYDTSPLPRFPKIVNSTDVSHLLQQRDFPPNYMALMTESMPNYFSISATYAPLQGSWFPPAEALTKYIVKVLDKMQTERILSLRPKPKAVQHWVRHANAFNERLAQSGPCACWYKGKDGRPLLWPGGKSQYLKVLENPRFEDFDMVYEDEEDMFAYMGNGFALDPDGIEGTEKVWYIDKPARQVDGEVLDKLRGNHSLPLVGANGVQPNGSTDG